MARSLSRRDFLHVTGAAAFVSSDVRPVGNGRASRQAGLTVSQPVQPAEVAAGWFDRPMRWVQLTLVENDPGRFDPQHRVAAA